MPSVLRLLTHWRCCRPALPLPKSRAWLDRDSARLAETVTLNVEASGSGSGRRQ